MSAVVFTGENRRGKTALFLFVCGWAGIAPHMLDKAQSFFPAISLAFLLGGYGLRTVLRDRKKIYESQKQNEIEFIDGNFGPGLGVDALMNIFKLIDTSLINEQTTYPRVYS